MAYPYSVLYYMFFSFTYPAISLNDRQESFKPNTLGLIEDTYKISFVTSFIIYFYHV
jgi:hypothetical protein